MTGTKTTLLSTDAVNVKADKTRVLPFAVVIKAGEGFKWKDIEIKEGDVIRLHDTKCITQKDPVFEVFAAKKLNNASSEMVSKQSTKFLHKFFYYYSSNIFIIDPMKNEPDFEDYFTIRIGEPDICAIFEDPKVLL
jgi:hypothetical protein